MLKFWSDLWLKLKPILGLVVWAVVILWLAWLLSDMPVNSKQAGLVVCLQRITQNSGSLQICSVIFNLIAS